MLQKECVNLILNHLNEYDMEKVVHKSEFAIATYVEEKELYTLTYLDKHCL